MAGLCLFLPIIYGLPVYAFTWLTGLGGFLNPYLFHASTRQYASPDLPTALAVFLLIDLTKGMAIQFALALGEEIGWRGLLVPELAKTNSFTKTALISGIFPYITGEFGVGLVLTSLVLAYIFWRMQWDGSWRTQPVPVQPIVRPEQSGVH